jgi:outer membrane protein OmpA-like peptidoglycan-associated protein
MRPLPILSAVFLTVATPVLAQVTVDLHALEGLPGQSPASRPVRPPAQAAPRVVTRAPATASAVPSTPSSSVGVAAAPAQRPSMPESVPDTASIVPIAPTAPPPGTPPPPPPPVSDKAATAATPITTGLRLTFAPGESDLSPDSSASIKQLTAGPLGDLTTFNVMAYAPGKADDPSTARRISLSRAMAVRSALVADGVPSARIFVRALGEQFGDGPPDRVDITVMGTNAPSGTAAAK